MKRWHILLAAFAGLLVVAAIVIAVTGVSTPLPEHHGLDDVGMLDGTHLEVVLPSNAFLNMPAAPNPEFAVDVDRGMWMISNGEVWRARANGDSQIHWEQLDPNWKGINSIALTREGALLATRGFLLTQYSQYTEDQKPFHKMLPLDGVLLPHQHMRLASSNLPGTIYAFGAGDGIDARRVYAFYDAGETAIVCEVPERVQAVADGSEGLYVATAREIYRFDIDGEHRAILLSLPSGLQPIRAIAVTEDERTLVWSTDQDIGVIEGRASLPLVVGFGGVVRILGNELYAYSPTRKSLIRIRMPDPK